MRILLLGSHLRYNLEHFVKLALERLQCEVKFVGYRDSLGALTSPVRVAISRSNIIRHFISPLLLRKYNKMIRKVSQGFEPDVVLVLKGEAVLPDTVDWISKKQRALTALWYPDDPRYFDSLSKLIAPHYEFVFTSSERSVSIYEELGIRNVLHLPFGCDPNVHRRVKAGDQEMEKLACDICFVGTFSPKRSKIVRDFEKAGFQVGVWGPYWKYFKRGPTTRGPIFGPQLALVFNAAKIVLNVHDDNDLRFKPNMRVFEATSCGTLMLSDKPFGIESFFDIGKEIVCYRDKPELFNLARYYLENGQERREIGVRAQTRAQSQHTYDIRMRAMLKSMLDDA